MTTVTALAFLRSEHAETGQRGQRGQDAAQAVGLFFGMGTGGQTKGENIIYIYIIGTLKELPSGNLT